MYRRMAKFVPFALLITIFSLVNLKAEAAKEIFINIPSQTLVLKDGNTVIATYRVAVGKSATPTPVGHFTVREKIVNPVWVNPQDTNMRIVSGPSNPLGYRWIGIGGNYGIHGTIHPESIGHYASNGCIRMHEKDVENLFSKITVGTPVTITYDRFYMSKNKDGVVGYGLYGDGYSRVNISIKDITSALEKYNLKDFIDAKKIVEASKYQTVGRWYPLAKVMNISYQGKILKSKAYDYNGNLYLPLSATAAVARTYYDMENYNIAVSKQGKAKVAVFNNRYYIPLTEIKNLFPLNYGFENSNTIILERVEGIAQKAVDYHEVYDQGTNTTKIVITEDPQAKFEDGVKKLTY